MEALGHVYQSHVPGWVGEELVATYGRFQLRAPLVQVRSRVVKKTQYVLYLAKRDGTFQALRSISDHHCDQADILDAVRGVLRARIEVLQNAKAARDQVISGRRVISGKERLEVPPGDREEHDEYVRKAEIDYRETVLAVAELEEASMSLEFDADNQHHP